MASQVLGWTDRYFAQAGIYRYLDYENSRIFVNNNGTFRDDCHRSDSLLSIIWKSTLGKYMGR